MNSVRTSSRAHRLSSRSVLGALLFGGALALSGCGHEAHATPPVQTTTQQEAAAAAPLGTVNAPPPAGPVPATFDVAALAERVTPLVVNITTTQKMNAESNAAVDPFDFFLGPRGGQRGPERQQSRSALGTGFIIAPDGYVVTNAHVVEGADQVKVRLADEREFEADVVGRDPKLDLALIKLRGAKDLPVAALGTSEQLRVGEHVLAVGNPFGLGHTVTLGIVSAKARAIGAGPYDDFIQTDASINPGNSGGPLFNWRGDVIGINTAIRAGANGIGFAIPVDALKDILPQLREKGHVERGKLGLLFQPITNDLARALGLPSSKGALVAELEPGGAAERAGIKAGDVIVGVNGTNINHAEDLPRNVARNAPGSQIKVTVMRSGKPFEVTAKLDALKDDDDPAPVRPTQGPGGAKKNADKLGAQVSSAQGGGVRVERVTDPNSELQPGDVIVELNGAKVNDTQSLEQGMAQLKPGSTALFKVKRGRVTRFAAVTVGAER
ncbi:Do family serine endopeptidase [Polyangium aurulentum]|uniref:Do family serine endopeptidase n=1 Tax=Polyangium aurulentum TaxID=2567896 RepID=UPI0010ADDCD6|nr:Do family serine endopeptidase [Polyangium aurulentum]UQA58796.1 Do family serine endopeptidase [Polyangium aurulentum]